MKTTVHILNGDSTLYSLQKSRLKGEYIVWRELLCEGPLVKDVGSDEFWRQRYEYFETELQVSKLEYYDKTIKELIKIEDLSTYNEVVLWFEYDLFCQVNLMALCAYLLKHYKKDILYYLICVGNEEGRNGWQTLADFSPTEYQNLYENRTKLSRDDLLYANECWKVFVEGTKEDLKSFDFNKNHKFQYFDVAIKQHVKNAYKVNGLDLIARKALKIIESRACNKKEIIQQLLDWQYQETVNGFGDLQYGKRLNDLKDYYEIENNIYSLNNKGKELLA